MKKVLLVFLSFALFSVSSNAQFFQIGVKGGINFANLAIDDIKIINTGSEVYDLVSGDRVTGFNAGLMARIKIAMLFVQPEVYFTSTGGVVEQVMQSGASELLNVQFNRVDIPLLAGVKLGPARVNVGPVGSIVVNSTNELKDLYGDLGDIHKDLTWGFQAGVGIDLFKKISIDGRYEGSLSKYGDTFTVAGTEHKLDARPSQWIVALGFWF